MSVKRRKQYYDCEIVNIPVKDQMSGHIMGYADSR